VGIPPPVRVAGLPVPVLHGRIIRAFVGHRP
jgi:hypothetical protein